MNKETCSFCSKNITAITCSSCSEITCKVCSYFIDENSFEMISLLPETIKDKVFCPTCYNDGVEEQLDELHKFLESAKQVDVFDKTQGKETRRFHRKEEPISVENCSDKEETLLRLAFIAAQMGYNTIVDVDLISTKTTVGGAYKRLIWKGSCLPVNPPIRH